LSGALLLTSLAGAPPAFADGELPMAESILDGYVEATGGRDAYDSVRNRVSKGTVEMVAQGIKLDMTVYAARPNRIYVVAVSETVGKMESGVHNDVAWSNSTMQGPLIKEGQEAIDALRDATFDRLVQWRKNFKKMETLGIEPVEGRPAYKVHMIPTTGTEQTLWFDRDSRMLVKIESTIENQMGTIPVEAFLSDYRDVDGLRLPHLIRVNVLGQERLVTTNSVEHNVKMADDRFDLPADVQAILHRETAKQETAKTAGHE
jgi:hypothetical protein